MDGKKLLIIAILALAITLIAANWDKVKAATIKPAGGNGDQGTGSSSGGSTGAGSSSGSSGSGTSANSTVLKSGSSGAWVRELQTFLNAVNNGRFTPLVVDGAFGSKTSAALVIVTGKNFITLAELATYKAAGAGTAAAGFGNWFN